MDRTALDWDRLRREASSRFGVRRFRPGQRELIEAVLTGQDAPPLDGLLGELAEGHPGLEIDVQEGGQPHYPLLLSAE